MHIQPSADSNDGNRMMAMVMIAMMIVLVMVMIVPEALRKEDSVRQHQCQTFQKLRDFQRPNASQRKLNSVQSMHLSAAALKHRAVMKTSSRL